MNKEDKKEFKILFGFVIWIVVNLVLYELYFVTNIILAGIFLAINYAFLFIILLETHRENVKLRSDTNE